MASLKEIFKNYTGILREFKLVYVINNWFNRKKLARNKEIYKKQGVKKRVFEAISSAEFEHMENELPWLDQEGALEKLKQHKSYQSFNEKFQAQLNQFVEKGFMVLEGFYNDEEVKTLIQEVDRLLNEKKAGFNFSGRKVVDAHRVSELIDQKYFRNKRLIKVLEFLMGKKIIPFQTINFLIGSEQKAHSDSIHMTTQPPGYMIAAWTALEDCDERNGTLMYYPGSHRLEYVMSIDYDSGNSKHRLGKQNYENYEKKIAELIKEKGLKKEYFHAKKGDVLIWHANLLHGGSPILEKGSSRKSMVAHYYCDEVICYHEITQRPAILPI